MQNLLLLEIDAQLRSLTVIIWLWQKLLLTVLKNSYQSW